MHDNIASLAGTEPPEPAAPPTFFTTHIAHAVIVGSSVFGLFWGCVNALLVKQIDMSNTTFVAKVVNEESAAAADSEKQPLVAGPDGAKTDPDQSDPTDKIMTQLTFIGRKITEGANSFLGQEYLYLTIFSAVFGVLLGATVDWQEISREDYGTNFPYTATAFLVGCGTSILAGYIGMTIAVYTNTRTTFQCCRDAHSGFLAAFRGGQVLGFTLVGLALLVLDLILVIFKAAWLDGAWAQMSEKMGGFEAKIGAGEKTNAEQWDNLLGENPVFTLKEQEDLKELVRRLFELVAGYGLGGSSVALFGRVGGGIYTKAADVGADLVGKTLLELKEDDANNPGTIADNVGDNVGDIAGMGADLFGSLAEATCAALVVSSTSLELIMTQDALYFPLMITAAGIVASFVTVLTVHFATVTVDNVGTVLKAQLGISTLLMTACVLPLIASLPAEFTFSYYTFAECDAGSLGCENGWVATQGRDPLTVTNWTAYFCIIFGLWSGMVIGFTTEYYTSNNYGPTLHLAESCRHGPAPNVIQGLALGYTSCVVPILCITATIGYAFSSAGMYGIGLAALGMLGSLPVALTIDGYGPISDNAGGIAEMSGLPESIRDITDALDAAGNTTAAVGKGFAIGSACLVGLALFGAFITRIGGTSVDILQPVQFAGLLVGAMLPYAFSAMTMKAVGDAAFEMMDFIVMDYGRGEKLRAEGKGDEYTPDYDGCIKISTDASLKKMVAPGALVLGSPLLAGFLFGPDAVAGLLAGAIVSGVQVAISASNTGGAWDNAKKEVEKRRSGWRKELHAAGFEDIGEAEAKLGQLPQPRAGPDGAVQKTQQYYDLEQLIERGKALREQHIAAVVGDTVGDPLKDTSGPAINILIKLSAITSLVFGNYIAEYNMSKWLKSDSSAE